MSSYFYILNIFIYSKYIFIKEFNPIILSDTWVTFSFMQKYTT